MSETNSALPSNGKGLGSMATRRAFFSPSSSIALDFEQLVMEAKSIEANAYAPTPSDFDFNPVERKDVREAEQKLNSISFEEALRLSMRLMGATSSANMSFSVPSFQRKAQLEQNEQIVSELRSFGTDPSKKMSVRISSYPSQDQDSTPTQSTKTRGGVLLGGLLSKLKSSFLSKPKKPGVFQQTAGHQTAGGGQQHQKSFEPQNSSLPSSQEHPSFSKDSAKISPKPQQVNSSKDLPQMSSSTHSPPAEKIFSPKSSSAPSLDFSVGSSRNISSDYDSQPSFTKKGITNADEQDSSVDVQTPSPPKTYPQDSQVDSQSPIAHKREHILKKGPKIFTPTKKDSQAPKIDGGVNDDYWSDDADLVSSTTKQPKEKSYPITKKAVSKKRGSSVRVKKSSLRPASKTSSSSEVISNLDTGGFDAPLISPKRKTTASPPKDEIQSQTSNKEGLDSQSYSHTEPNLSVPKKRVVKKISKKPKPWLKENSKESKSEGVKTHTVIPHFGGQTYRSKELDPVSELHANYDLNKQLSQLKQESSQSLSGDKKFKQTAPKISNTPEPTSVSDSPKKISNAPEQSLSKKPAKPLINPKSPPSIPSKKEKPVQNSPSALDELEAAAKSFVKKDSGRQKPIRKTPPIEQQSPSKSIEKPLLPNPAEQNLSDDLKKSPKQDSTSQKREVSPSHTKQTISSSLAKRLGLSKPKPPKQDSKPEESSNESWSDTNELDDAQVSDSKNSNPTQNSPGLTDSRLSSREQDLLASKGQVDSQTKASANMMADELLFAYAKENHKWLFEIYKMGGLSIDEFRKKVKEKMSSNKGKSSEDADSEKKNMSDENQAFSNLSAASDKKFKK